MYQKFDKQRESLGLLRHLNAMGYNAEAAVWFGWRVCEDIVKSPYNAIYSDKGQVKVCYDLKKFYKLIIHLSMSLTYLIIVL